MPPTYPIEGRPRLTVKVKNPKAKEDWSRGPPLALWPIEPLLAVRLLNVVELSSGRENNAKQSSRRTNRRCNTRRKLDRYGERGFGGGWDWGWPYGEGGYSNTNVVVYPQAIPQTAGVTGSVATTPCHWNEESFTVPSSGGGTRPVQVASCR